MQIPRVGIAFMATGALRAVSGGDEVRRVVITSRPAA